MPNKLKILYLHITSRNGWNPAGLWKTRTSRPSIFSAMLIMVIIIIIIINSSSSRSGSSSSSSICIIHTF